MNENEIKQFQKNFTYFSKIQDRDILSDIPELGQEYNYAITNGALISKYLFIDNTDTAYNFLSLLAKDIIVSFPDIYIFKIDINDILENNKIDLLKKFKTFLLYAHILFISDIDIINNNEETRILISDLIKNIHSNSQLVVSSSIPFEQLNIDKTIISMFREGRILSLKRKKENNIETFHNFKEFISQIKDEAGVDEELDSFEERNKYIEKLYIWEMKNFNVSRLKHIINEKDIEKIHEEFNRFTNNVRMLMELHKEYGLLNTFYFKKEAKEIEDLLFDPDKIDIIKEKITILKEKIQYLNDFRKNLKISMYLENFISDSSNHSVYNKMLGIINNQNSDNLIVVTGSHGTGKTHLLNAIINAMTDKKIILIDESNINFIKENNYIFKYMDMLDMILIDNLEDLFKIEKDNIKKIVMNNIPKVIVMHRKYSFEDKELLKFINNYPSFNIQPSSFFIKKTVIKNMFLTYNISINEIMLNYLLDYISMPLSEVEDYISKLKQITNGHLPDINQIHSVFPKKIKKQEVFRKKQFDTSKMIKEWSFEQDRLYVEFKD